MNENFNDISHIYWFAYFNKDEPSVRYRAIYPLDKLKREHNINYSFVVPGYQLKTILKFVYIYLSVLLFRKKGSIIVFQKIYSFGIYANALKLLLLIRKRQTIYDIDDAEHTRRPPKNVHFFMKHCSICTAGSQTLVNYTKKFNDNSFLLTSPVINHGVSKTSRESIFTIGWIGYYKAHSESLKKILFPALLGIDTKVRLMLLGVEKQEERVEIEKIFKPYPNVILDIQINLNWHDELAIYNLIKQFTVGVSPLLNTEFNRSKSAFKLKQCLSVGIPVLASPIGENIRFLNHGKNGFICNSSKEFKTGIEKFTLISIEDYAKFILNSLNSYPEFSLKNYCLDFLRICTLDREIIMNRLSHIGANSVSSPYKINE